MQTLVIGGGITGCAVSRFLRMKGIPCEIWEKDGSLGGRAGLLAGADVGCQYVTKQNSEVYIDLMEKGLLQDFNGSIKGENIPYTAASLVAPQGFRSVAEDMASGATVHTNKEATRIEVGPCGIEVNGNVLPKETSVVLTVPLNVYANIAGHGMPKVAAEYSKRWVVVVDCEISEPVPWVCYYYPDGPVRYACFDTAKRDPSGPEATCTGRHTLLLHSSVPYGLRTSGSMDALPAMLDDITAKLPHLTVHGTTTHFLDVSQVYKRCPHTSFFKLPDHSVFITGDAFAATPNFEGCVTTACSTAEALCKL